MSTRGCFEDLLGVPFRTLELRSRRRSISVPTELEILYFEAPVSPTTSTIVATNGLSIPKPGTSGAFEFCMKIAGSAASESLDALGRALAELSVISFREGVPWEPFTILED